MLIPNTSSFLFALFSFQALGFMELSIPYSSVEDVNIISRWDAGQKFCIRITVPDGSVLLQVGSKARKPHGFVM